MRVMIWIWIAFDRSYIRPSTFPALLMFCFIYSCSIEPPLASNFFSISLYHSVHLHDHHHHNLHD